MINIPRLFINSKTEFTRATKAFWSTHTKTEKIVEETSNYKDKVIEKKTIDLESYGEYWLIIQDMLDFISDEESSFSEKMKLVMNENETDTIYLPKNECKIVFNSESEWFDVLPLDRNDWKKINKECNEKYLNR